VAGYLLERGLVEPAAVVRGGLAVRQLHGRNRNFEVTSRDGPDYVVKQGIGPDGAAAIAREAAVYRLLGTRGEDGVARYAPRVHAHDPELALLVLAHAGDARDLRTHHRTGRYSKALATAVGGALAALHRTTATVQGPAPGPPWVLSLHQPWVDWMREISGASLELIRLVQTSPELAGLLDELRSDCEVQCVVHNDFKWDNCLALRGRDGRATGVMVIDWEAACPGDPAWDVGSAFADYLATWLLSIPVTGQDPPERFAELARSPLDPMRPAIRALWASYVRAAGLDAPAANRLLIRSVRFSAARLLQTGYEQTQMTLQMPGTTRCLLQVAFNVLRRPQEAAVRLLSIPLEREAAA
jgi:aminoglycoside phosphotransferase (APT) family kinase protein